MWSVKPGTGAKVCAVRIARRPIDLLLSDVVIAGSGRRELAEGVLKLRPASVMFMSGHTQDVVLRGASRRESILQKHLRLLDCPKGA